MNLVMMCGFPLQASAMLYFGQQMGAHDAKECGLVSQVFPHSTFEQEVWHKLEQFAQMPKQVMLDFFFNTRLWPNIFVLPTYSEIEGQ
jgi:1,4-dihydroxy-2-naphthoyl-CoA synthase